MSYRSTYYVNDPARRFDGVTGREHNSVLRRTRALFSGQGYRVDRERSHTGHVVLTNGTDTVVIEVTPN